MRKTIIFLVIVIQFFGAVKSYSQENKSLFQISLEELLEIKITSVAKKPQKLTESPAAIFVITREDIRRSGVTSIAEALRLAPGVHVGRINSHKWAVSIRGFQQELAGKLLVLIDGRSVYSPTFSGVFWETQDVMLEDIERIEVIRGPGGTLWGANAMNGVINIITRSAKDTQGGILHAGAGNEESGFGGIRYGGRSGDIYWRVYTKYFERDKSTRTRFEESEGLDDMNDDWEMFRTGFRADWDGSGDDLITVQGDIYYGETNDIADDIPVLTPPYAVVYPVENTVQGGNLLGRWTRKFSETSAITLQVYYDRTDREDNVNVNIVQDTFDIDFQHLFAFGRHDLMWGLGYRFTHDDLGSGPAISFDPESQSADIFSSFVQDEITLIDKVLRLTLGSKFEHNDYTGFEVQPSARILWLPHERHQLWAAVSRAVRTPNRVERDIYANSQSLPPDSLFPGQPAGYVQLTGQDDVDSEEMVAYELGYRLKPTAKLFFDFSLYFNDYDKLIFLDSEQGLGEPFINDKGAFVLPAFIGNTGEGEVYGFEIYADWQPTDWWKLKGSYTFVEMDLHGDEVTDNIEGETPENQFHVHSYLDLPHNFQLDAGVFYIDEITGFSTAEIDKSVRVDIRLGWMPKDNLELSLVGQDIFDNHGTEHGEKAFGTHSEIERSFYTKVTYRF